MSLWERDRNAATTDLINHNIQAIRQITNVRYYSTERGFAPEFYRHLYAILENNKLFPNHTILEAEVQKRTKKHYGVKQRPDILIHIPLEQGLTENANENNFVNYAFKLRGYRGEVKKDFNKLDQMFLQLNYELGFFINVSAYPRTYLSLYEGNFKSRIHELSIGLVNGLVSVKHSFFVDENLVINEV